MAWRVILNAVDGLIAGLPDADRALVTKLARREAERNRADAE